MVRGFGGSVYFVALVASSQSDAQPSPTPRTSSPELTWSAPANCPTAEGFRERVRGYLGRPIPAETTLSAASAQVTQLPGGYRVALQVEQQGQLRERMLQTRTCVEALDAAALVVALAVDPNVMARSSAATPAAPAPTSSTNDLLEASPPDSAGKCRAVLAASVCEPCQPVPTAPTSPCPKPLAQRVQARAALARAPEPRRTLPLSLHLASEVSLRQLPGVSLGVGIAAAYDIRQIRLALTVVTHRGIRRQGSSAGDFRIVEGRLGGCWMPGNTLAVGPCGALGAGAVQGAGLGVDVPERATRTWVSANFGVMLRYNAGDRATVGAYVNAEVPIVRPAFDLAGTEFYRPPAIGILPGLMIGARF